MPPSHADKAALAYLRRYDGAIRWAINGARIPEQDRADVHQEVRIRLLMRFRKHGPVEAQDKSALSYAIAVARSACANYLNARQRRPVAGAAACAGTMAVSDAASPDVLAMRNDARHRLHLAVLALPPLSRHVMRETLRGRTLVEIAREIEVPVGTVKSLAHRARTLLRKRLVR